MHFDKLFIQATVTTHVFFEFVSLFGGTVSNTVACAHAFPHNLTRDLPCARPALRTRSRTQPALTCVG